MSTTAAAFYHAQNAALQARQHELETLACKALVNSFDAKTATIEQSRDYADCIYHLHPKDMGGTEAVMLKIVIAFCLACMVLGTGLGWSENGEVIDAVGGGVIGLCASVVFCLLVLLVWTAVAFLFT